MAQIGAIELSFWSPRRFRRDRLVYVEFPVATVHASAADLRPDEAEEILGAAQALISRVETESETTWSMDRDGLIRESNQTVAELTREYEKSTDRGFAWDPDALWYIGQGEKLAVHRAGIAPERRA